MGKLRVDVKRLVDRFANTGRVVLDKLKRRDWRLWLLVTMVLYGVLEAARSVVGDTTTLLLVSLFRALSWLVRQPMGLGGLAFLLYLAVLMGISWWQTRPKPEPKVTPPPALSDHERRLVQDVRTIWNRFGRIAVSQFRDIFHDTVYELKRKAYWGELLDPVVEDLSRSIDAMSHAVASNSELSITAVRDRFNDMYLCYVKAMRWFVKLNSDPMILFDARRQERLNWWRTHHYEFYDRLRNLHEQPEHNQTLKIFPFIDDDRFGRFLREAETRPTLLPPEDREPD